MWQLDLNLFLTVISAILQILAFGAALLFLYAAAFTYETEENRVQSVLEEWWLRLAEEDTTSANRAARFLQTVTELTTHVLDRMFGTRLFSVRMVSVSICYAYAASNLSAFMLLSFFVPEFPATNVTLWIGLLFIAAGTLPTFHPSLRWLTYLITCCLFVLAIITVWLIENIYSEQRLRVVENNARALGLLPADHGLADVFSGEMSVLLLAGVMYGVLIITLVRFTIQTSSTTTTSIRLVALLGSTLILALIPLIVIGGITVPAFFLDPSPARARLMASLASVLRDPVLFRAITHIGGPNILWGLATLLVVAIAVVLVLHIVIWPLEKFVLTRTIYSAHRHKMIKNKKALWAIAAGLTTIACSGATGLIRTVQALFGG